MAGVKQMIISLWRVPDKETTELMTLFYTYWLNGQTPPRSVKKGTTEDERKVSALLLGSLCISRNETSQPQLKK